MFHSVITRRFAALILFIVLLSLGSLGAYLLHFFYQNTLASKQAELIRNAKIIEITLAEPLIQRSTTLAAITKDVSQETGLRVTLLDAQGKVIADSSEPASTLDNHLQRAEVQAALQSDAGYGVATRYSETLQENLMYTAIPVYANGQLTGVIRTATSLQPLEAAYAQIERSILLALGIALLLALAAALFLARRQLQLILHLSREAAIIAQGNLTHRINLHTGDEFDILIHTINQLTTKLQGMYQRQADFTSNAAHELATPLTSISGFAELLCDDDFSSPKSSRHCAEVIYQQAQRMNHLLQDLLQLSRLDDQEYRRKFPTQLIDANQVLLLAAGSLQKKAINKHLTLNIQLADKAPKIKAAQNLMEQVLRNLIDNAIKYTPENGSIIARCQADATYVYFIVQDSGIGIPQESLPYIFDRFYRVDKSRARKSGGNGIGLALVKYVVDFFHGQVTVSSQLGKGSTFTLRFANASACKSASPSPDK